MCGEEDKKSDQTKVYLHFLVMQGFALFVRETILMLTGVLVLRQDSLFCPKTFEPSHCALILSKIGCSEIVNSTQEVSC